MSELGVVNFTVIIWTSSIGVKAKFHRRYDKKIWNRLAVQYSDWGILFKLFSVSKLYNK